MNYSNIVKSEILNEKPGTLINASAFFQTLKSHVSEASFFKILERLVKQGVLVKIGKGIYSIPEKTKFGPVAPSEEKTITTFIPKKEYGCEIGYGMYHKLGLTTQIAKNRYFLVSKLEATQKKVGNLIFIRTGMRFSNETVKMIQLLEILQNFESFEDFDHAAFETFLSAAVPSYSDNVLKTILSTRSYKKSTLATLREILNVHHISNDVEQYLSVFSTYKIPDWKEPKKIKSSR